MEPNREARTILRPEWIIDGTGAPPLVRHAVAIAGERVEAVAPVAEIPKRPEDRVLDLAGATLLPGLINNHVHLVLPGDNTPFVPWIDLQSDATLSLRAAHNVPVSLRSG